jgi:hypothetical protein
MEINKKWIKRSAYVHLLSTLYLIIGLVYWIPSTVTPWAIAIIWSQIIIAWILSELLPKKEKKRNVA